MAPDPAPMIGPTVTVAPAHTEPVQPPRLYPALDAHGHQLYWHPTCDYTQPMSFDPSGGLYRCDACLVQTDKWHPLFTDREVTR